MITFIDAHRDAYGLEPICRVLPIAPSTYSKHVAQGQDRSRLSARARKDLILKPEIARVFAESFAVYGLRKIWRQMMREGLRNRSLHRRTADARDGLGRRDPGQAGACDHQPRGGAVPARSRQPPVLRASAEQAFGVGLTYVATWAGFVYVAFVIDTYARRIVGWCASRTAHASFVVEALEQALHDRRPTQRGGLIHHSDRGSQYVSIKYTERLAGAGIEPSVGSVGNIYDDALAETINGFYKAGVIHRRGPWRSFEAVEYATLEWVDWFNHRRLLEPIGNIPPTEAEDQYYAAADNIDLAA
ncbi:IS3 family transposase [Sphingomonas sp. NFX23]|uniref:IS3 family transposase n=1 Tax=Sphingomonas sp. NFX23 TaxID=2819532 RepID=UPI003CF6EF17